MATDWCLLVKIGVATLSLGLALTRDYVKPWMTRPTSTWDITMIQSESIENLEIWNLNKSNKLSSQNEHMSRPKCWQGPDDYELKQIEIS